MGILRLHYRLWIKAGSAHIDPNVNVFYEPIIQIICALLVKYRYSKYITGWRRIG
jgi:hypothetical protein